MPSGSRKRKAAKKKQGKFTHSSVNQSAATTSSTHGGEDLKHHESDGDHNTDGDVQVEKAAGQDHGGGQFEGEPKPGNGFDQKKGDSSSSDSSSDSDDGSPKVEKNLTIVENAPEIDLAEEEHPVSELRIEVTPTPLVTKLDDPVAECASEVVGDNILVLDEKVLVESGASADSSTSPNVVELGHKENGEANLISSVESARLPLVTNELTPEDQKEPGVMENAPEIDLVEDKHSVSELPAEVTHASLVTKLDDSVAECVSEVVGENNSVLDEKILVPLASADSSSSPGVVELGQKENGEANLSSPELTASLPEVTKELAQADQKESVVENAPEIDFIEEEHLVSELPVEVTRTPPVTKMVDPVSECVSEDVGENISVLNEKVIVVPGDPAYCFTSPDVVEFGQKENGEVNSNSPVESSRLSEVTKELAPENQKDENASLPEVTTELAPEEKKNEIIDVAATSEAAVHSNEEKLSLKFLDLWIARPVSPPQFNKVKQLLGRVVADSLRHLQAPVDNCRIIGA
ncbi:hypothetical protein Leryth_010362 [Lithospermum erythrorhizon]|nr:hypothetical protein Leryth_010362 [Lithospermum erythrorhizon]